MAAKTKRKLIACGQRSAGVVLPADFRRFYNLNPGDEVSVFYDSIILIVPKQHLSRIERDPRISQLLRGGGADAG